MLLCITDRAPACFSRTRSARRSAICRGRFDRRAKSSLENRASERPETPLIDALVQYHSQESAAFHIPGHKRGAGASDALLSIIGDKALRSDLTELPGLDNLANSTGPIAKSQALAAKAFGADGTWYLVNGTTVGLQAAVFATCNPGDTLIITRNCHVCCFSAMALADVLPLWVETAWHSSSDLPACITPAALEASFETAKSRGVAPKAVIVVSPTYFGACCAVAEYAELCHRRGAVLIVDSAHGAHHGLHPGFPDSAIQAGADIVVQSTHKTLLSLGQSSMLHCRGSLVSEARITSALRMLQTTSPSYLLLASLDAAQAYAHALARGLITPLLDPVATARAELQALPGVTILEAEPGTEALECSVKGYDPWRITLNMQGLGRTGFDIQEELQEQHAVYPEMATYKMVVFALGPGTSQADLNRLVAAMTAISETGGKQVLESFPLFNFEEALQEASVSPREAFFAEKEFVAFEDAIGRISGDIICPYPPGVPVVCAGERLTQSVLKKLSEVLELGGVVTGATDQSLAQLLLVEACRAEIGHRACGGALHVMPRMHYGIMKPYTTCHGMP